MTFEIESIGPREFSGTVSEVRLSPVVAQASSSAVRRALRAQPRRPARDGRPRSGRDQRHRLARQHSNGIGRHGAGDAAWSGVKHDR